MSRAVTWEGFHNTRDLGGLPTGAGHTTRRGAFFRAADLRFVTEAGWAQARESGVRTVIDLRNADEIRPTTDSPTALAGSAQFAAAAAVTTPAGVRPRRSSAPHNRGGGGLGRLHGRRAERTPPL